MYRVIVYDGPDDVIGTVIHSPYVNNEKVSSGSVQQVISGIDSMDFTINPRNVGWGKIKPLTTLIKVMNIKTGLNEFEARILKQKQNMSAGGLFTIQYECESFLAFLLDSIQRHDEIHNKSIAEFLQILLNNHNPQVEPHKRFKLGNVTVTNTTDNVYRYLDYQNTYDTIKEKLIDRLGGYLVVRHEADGLYLDYLAEVGTLSTTTIKLRRNLKSMSREIDPTEVITRLVPLGAQIDSSEEGSTDVSKARVDVKTVNGGLDYIDDERLIAEFGIIEKTITFDDINQPNILMTKGQQYLDSQKASKNAFELTPLDLSLNGLDAKSIVLGDWYQVENPIFSINEPLQVVQKNLNIVNPLDIKTTIGEKFKTLTQYQVEANKGLKQFNELRTAVTNQSLSISTLKNSNAEITASYNAIQVSYNSLATTLEIDADTGTSLALSGLKTSIDSLVGTISNYDFAEMEARISVLEVGSPTDPEPSNLFNMTTITAVYIDSDGSEKASTELGKTSDFIQIDSVNDYKYTQEYNNTSGIVISAYLWIAYYDVNKVFLSHAWRPKGSIAIGATGQFIENFVTLPTNTAYIRLGGDIFVSATLVVI